MSTPTYFMRGSPLFTEHGVHLIVELGDEVTGGVVAVLHLAVLHGGDLHDAGQVSARTDGDGDHRQDTSIMVYFSSPRPRRS